MPLDTLVRPQPSEATPAQEQARLLAGYAAAAAPFDEMLAPDGTFRPHWQRFVEGFAALGPDGRAAAAESTRRLLRESGIAFNVYADPDDRQHAWRLDLVPVLLPDQEWDSLARGIVQRARLIDAVLADLHGTQALLHDGSLPASLVLGSPGYVRASVDRAGAPRRFLYTYACDVARTATGDWVVLGDQTDTAIGNGYVLASRVALSHGLAGLFRDCHTKRLARYFLGLQESFQALCRRDDGRIVLLSPGPESPSYFSHSYLARYLGYSAVQSGDLTIRDNNLYLKTLDGLQRVYLVVCKQPGHLMDPLHLPGSGMAGIPGLVQAARSGTVAMVNRLGSGVLQNHSLAPFTAGLFRRVLGEAPLLQDVRTLWLGDPQNRATALADPEHWAYVEAAARNDPGEPSTMLGGGPLTEPARQALQERVQREGHRWVAVEPLRLATTPSFDGTSLVPTPFALRAYVVVTEDGYQVLPGGLVRLAGAPTCRNLAQRLRQQGSVGHRAERRAAAAQHPAHVDAGSASPPDRPRPAQPHHRQSVLARPLQRACRGDHAPAAQRPRPLPRGRTPRQQSGRAATAAAPVPAKNIGCDPAAREPGWDGVEELVGVLMFAQRSYGLRDTLDDAAPDRDPGPRPDQPRRVAHAERLAHRPAVAPAPAGWPGLADARTARRRHPLAQCLQRHRIGEHDPQLCVALPADRPSHRACAPAVELTRELVVNHAAPENDGSLRLLLELGDSYMTYRSRYLMTPLTAPVLDLLLLDETNPRGVAFQLRELDDHFRQVAERGSAPQPWAAPDPEAAHPPAPGRGRRTLRRRRCRPDAQPGHAAGRIDRRAADLSDVISRSYFAHAETPVVTLAMRRRDEP